MYLDCSSTLVFSIFSFDQLIVEFIWLNWLFFIFLSSNFMPVFRDLWFFRVIFFEILFFFFQWPFLWFFLVSRVIFSNFKFFLFFYLHVLLHYIKVIHFIFLYNMQTFFLFTICTLINLWFELYPILY